MATATKPSKATKLKQQEEQAESLINTHTFMAAGAGLIPIKGLDILAVTGVQMSMTRKLSEVFEKEYNYKNTKGLLTALVTSVAGRLVAFGVHSMFNAFPEFGKFSGHITNGIAAAATTYATGEILKEHFKLGGNLDDLEIDQFLDYYWNNLKEGTILPPRLAQSQNGFRAISKLMTPGV